MMGTAASSPLAREAMRCRPAPGGTSGWVKISFQFTIAKHMQVSLCYTPDRHILDRASGAAWLQHYKEWTDGSESLAIQLLDDFRNEVVPRWVRLRLQCGKDCVVEIEDKQPNWTPRLDHERLPGGL